MLTVVTPKLNQFRNLMPNKQSSGSIVLESEHKKQEVVEKIPESSSPSPGTEQQ